jgi:hypothetical protein
MRSKVDPTGDRTRPGLPAAEPTAGRDCFCEGAAAISQILAIKRQDIEGMELDLVVMFPRVQSMEIGDAVDAEQHRLAINDERGLPMHS